MKQACISQLDKDLNTFAMRIKEWYSWHFPVSCVFASPGVAGGVTRVADCWGCSQELATIVKDNYVYARVAKYIGNRSLFDESKLEVGRLRSSLSYDVGGHGRHRYMQGLTEITLDEAVSQQILDASRASMGMDTSDIDMLNIDSFATRWVDGLGRVFGCGLGYRNAPPGLRSLIALAEYRRNLSDYMSSKMSQVAPNLGALIGEPVAARLISHAGSLTNLAKVCRRLRFLRSIRALSAFVVVSLCVAVPSINCSDFGR
jgi:nucleolar protein 56